MDTPDVTVVVAVYNTMPYLTQCLDSLVHQSIGADRMEVVAVDDGSTDGSGAELDGWATRYPRLIKVLHQPNSGGPAAPSNRALELATGRYVFFLGADDHLGREALARLVATADELDADIVLGRMIGAGGRVVSQAVYHPGNRDDIDLVNSALPWALSNTKLFRRSMIEEHGIRYAEEMHSGSDQPFTIKAITVARRIAVRADYDFYYAVRRTDSSNITYRTSLDRFVQDTAMLMDTAADLITDPVARFRVLRRHFSWELGKLLGERLLAADRDQQLRVQDGIRKLADAYLSEDMRASLDVQHRVRLSIAQHGSLDDLLAVARHHLEHGLSPVIADNGRYYVGYPGFRSGGPAPDDWFDGTEQLRRMLHQTEPAEVRWGRTGTGRRALVVSWVSALPDLADAGDAPPRVFAGDRPAERTATEGDRRGGTRVRAELAADDLVTGVRRMRKLRMKFTWTDRGECFNQPVTARPGTPLRRVPHRRGLRFYLVGPYLDGESRLGVQVVPVTPRRVAGRLARALRVKR